MSETEIVSLLSNLVAIASVNSMGLVSRAGKPSSPAMVSLIERWLRERGITSKRQRVSAGEENLIATVPGPPGARTVVFDAHTDVVPADDWADRAFSPRVEGGRIYGRGSCDTKAAMAAMMAAMVEASRRDTRPHTIVLLASADEEFGRSGVRAFLDSKPAVNAAVVGEPTLCRPVIACKGAARWDIITTGRSAHSSRPREGVNAIVHMAEVIRHLDAYDREMLGGRTHPLVSRPTLTATVIQGGTAVNVVPELCRISVDLRTLPGESSADAMTRAQEFLASRCQFPLRHESVRLWSGAYTPPEHPFAACCIECCRAQADEPQDIKPEGVDYGCHASDYGDRGIPAVVVGPGDIRAAHAIDECVEIDQVMRAARIYLSLMTAPVAGL